MARLLNPFAAPAGIDGVFHPPYIALHLAVAERLGGHRLLVLKGAGGEAERNPAKPVAVHLSAPGTSRSEHAMPALASEPPSGAPMAQVWQGQAAGSREETTVIGSIALALLAMGVADPTSADTAAARLWAARPLPGASGSTA